MLNQMVDLARAVPWWDARAAAVIAETAKYGGDAPLIEQEIPPGGIRHGR
jgi:hypothetical protein